MSKMVERAEFDIADEEGAAMNLRWSRSGRRLILSVLVEGRSEFPHGVRLDLEQRESLLRYLTAGDRAGVFEAADDEIGRLHITWSRSGRRMILTASLQPIPAYGLHRQVCLDARQVEALRDYLTAALV